jgi:hypothetical protein
MANRPPKMLAFAFWRLRAYFRATATDAYAEWMAGAVIMCSESCGILAALFGVSALLRRRPIMPVSPMFSLVVLAVFVIVTNLYVLRLNGWKRFEKEFETYSTQVRSIGSVSVFAVVFLLITAMALTARAARSFATP